MREFKIFCVSSIDDPPKQLLRRDDSVFYQYIPVPIPDSVILFGIGDWPSPVGEMEVEVSIIYKDECVSLGMITEQTRALCWEKERSNVPSVMSSDKENGMAKLCIEFLSGKPTEDNQIESSVVKLGKNHLSDKEQNESTPKSTKKGKSKEATKPMKQKRKSNAGGKTEKTLTGPNPKKAKTTTRVRSLNSDVDSTSGTDKENAEIEPVLKIVSSPEVNKFTKMIESGKPSMALCKDLTSRDAEFDEKMEFLVAENMGRIFSTSFETGFKIIHYGLQTEYRSRKFVEVNTLSNLCRGKKADFIGPLWMTFLGSPTTA